MQNVKVAPTITTKKAHEAGDEVDDPELAQNRLTYSAGQVSLAINDIASHESEPRSRENHDSYLVFGEWLDGHVDVRPVSFVYRPMLSGVARIAARFSAAPD